MTSGNRTSRSDQHRIEALRDAMRMVLYVSIVLAATLAALPTGSASEGVEEMAEASTVFASPA